MILAVRLIVTDSKACASTKAHFLFRCNNLKLIDASSVLSMDEKQSLALSSCKKEDVPPGLGAAPGRRPDGREREPHDRTVRPGLKRSHGMQLTGQKMFSFSDMLFTKHWKQIPKKPFSKKQKLTPKKFAPNFVENDWP